MHNEKDQRLYYWFFHIIALSIEEILVFFRQQIILFAGVDWGDGALDDLPIDIRHHPFPELTITSNLSYIFEVVMKDYKNQPVNMNPKTPVRESYIPKIISRQTDKKIEVINYSEVLSGEKNLIQRVQQHIKNGINMIVIDAKEKEDFDLIASAITAIKEKVLIVGSSGLAGYLPKYFDIKKERKSNIIIAGSVSEVTRKQIDYANENLAVKLIDVETGKLFGKERHQEKNRIIDIIKESSRKGEDIIIRSASSKAIVTKSFEKGLEYGLDRFKVSEVIASFLGEIARFIIQEIKINGILFTGGETAIKATQSLNISGTIIQDEILPGIPYGYFVEEQYKNIIVVSKAGGFGNEDAIFQVLNFLKNG